MMEKSSPVVKGQKNDTSDPNKIQKYRILEFGVKLQHLKAQENLNAAYIYDICSRE